MPNRIIKESCTTSPTLDQVCDGAERLFFRLSTKADDTGRFDADPRVVLANCFPLRIDRLKTNVIEKWLMELSQAGLIHLYVVDGRRYGCFVNWGKHQRMYSLKSKFPEPPADCGKFPQVPADSGKLPQLAGNSGSYPISENRESRIDKSINGHQGVTGFEQFWSSYPKKKSKGQAEKAWTKLKPSEQLQEQILTALEQAKTSEQWTKDGEEFVPHPATWINAKGWLDEHTSPAALPQAKCAWANGEPCQDYSIPPSKYCADHKAKIVKVQQAHGVIPLEAKA